MGSTIQSVDALTLQQVKTLQPKDQSLFWVSRYLLPAVPFLMVFGALVFGVYRFRSSAKQAEEAAIEFAEPGRARVTVNSANNIISCNDVFTNLVGATKEADLAKKPIEEYLDLENGEVYTAKGKRTLQIKERKVEVLIDGAKLQPLKSYVIRVPEGLGGESSPTPTRAPSSPH
jgi:PAS domain-containing protein